MKCLILATHDGGCGRIDARQVALQPPMLSLINQIFSSAYMEVVYAPMALLVDVGSVCSFQALQARCRRRKAILLGYTEAAKGVIVLNPENKTTPRVWQQGERAILLYRNA
jgi:hypothetical protein